MGALTRCAGHCAIGPKKLDMAWQLIYTSASRSLEAGRSGFGTVARHRALSPLLVSAIERISQFSRLPGTNADRVIYCHRIIAVAGGRFHVLSAIRDAGADYTGRTNHIAHHLIIDPREVAQLGANGPSPAEVMLAMNWATSWNETPRFFEDSEEVKLSAIRSHSNGSAWGQIAGSPDQAWLLANGDASRGAYIIQPLRVDLRAIYAESLRLMPDRLWQTSFTTSLQPSDEPADFRWIGIEESSPLRTRIESSGRPVLNLAAPHLLPCVEISHSAPVLETRQRYPSASKPEPVIRRTMPAGRDTGCREPDTIPEPEYAERIPITAFEPRATSFRLRWIFGLLAVFLITIGVWIGRPLLRHWQHSNELRKVIRAAIARTSVFSDTVTTELIKQSDKLEAANRIAQAAARLATLALEASPEAIKHMPQPLDSELRQEASKAGINIPTEITALENSLALIGKLYLRLELPNPTESELGSWEGQMHAAVEHLPESCHQLRNKVESAVANKYAEYVYALLYGQDKGTLQPPQQPEWFLNKLQKLPKTTVTQPSDSAALKAVKDASLLIADWQTVVRDIKAETFTNHTFALKQGAERWPQWLKNLANATPISRKTENKITENPNHGKRTETKSNGNSDTSNSVPLYFLNLKSGQPQIAIEPIIHDLEYFLKQSNESQSVKLNVQDSPSENGIKRVFVNVQHSNPLFVVAFAQPSKPSIQFKSNDELQALQIPFSLSGRIPNTKSGSVDLFRLWVVVPTPKPIFGSHEKGLVRDGNLIKFDFRQLGFDGDPRNAILKVKLPLSCLPPKSPQTLDIALNNWTVDISPFISEADERIGAAKQLLGAKIDGAANTIDMHLKEFDRICEQLNTDAFRKDALIAVAALKDDTGKTSITSRFGHFIRAVMQKQKGDYEDAYNLAVKFEELKPNTDPTSETQLFLKFDGKLAQLIAPLKTQLEMDKKSVKGKEKKEQLDPLAQVLLSRLVLLKQMLAEVKECSPSAIASRKAAEQMASKRRNAIEVEHNEMQEYLKIMKKDVPKGTYRISTSVGDDILLFEITVK